jgi:tryptophan-rich sensory protein
MKTMEIVKLLISILICQLAGFIGSIFTSSSVTTWYRSLAKPSFTPPNWLFSPVWISLFVLMGVSAFMIWSKGLSDGRVRMALSLFAGQLILNILWSVLFFGFRSPLAGLIEILILWLAILLTVISFWRISSLSGLLLVPYLLWVSFAAVLNYSILTLNR